MFADEIRLPELAALCRRWATSLEAGLDFRKVLEREAAADRRVRFKRRLETLHAGIAEGESLQEGLGRTGEFFPLLFRRMTAVGEETGQLPEVLRRLAEHYDEQLTRRREFLRAIGGPALQLGAAILIVGFLIWVLGFISELLGTEAVDVLGIGLKGTSGMLIYFSVWGVLIVSLVLGWSSIRRSLARHGTMERVVSALPVIGPALRTLALARFAWALRLVFDTGMSLKKAIPLCLDATDHGAYTVQAGPLTARVTAGTPLSEALAQQPGYPPDFVDALEVGEQTGRIPETMEILSRQYQEKAQAALAALTKVLGFLVWLGVALLIGFMVIRIAYVAYIEPITKMANG